MCLQERLPRRFFLPHTRPIPQTARRRAAARILRRRVIAQDQGFSKRPASTSSWCSSTRRSRSRWPLHRRYRRRRHRLYRRTFNLAGKGALSRHRSQSQEVPDFARRLSRDDAGERRGYEKFEGHSRPSHRHHANRLELPFRGGVAGGQVRLPDFRGEAGPLQSMSNIVSALKAARSTGRCCPPPARRRDRRRRRAPARLGGDEAAWQLGAPSSRPD